jgi:hypothetical protein
MITCGRNSAAASPNQKLCDLPVCVTKSKVVVVKKVDFYVSGLTEPYIEVESLAN